MKLYLVRHGETENNKRHFFSGWSETPLSEKGIEDAKEAGKTLKEIPYDKIYVSDLKRALQTCEYALPDCDYEETLLLREVDVGSLTDCSYDDILPKMTEKESECRFQLNYTPWGGENRMDLRARGRKFLKMLESSGNDTVIAFTHEFFIKYLLEEIWDKELSYYEYRIRNGAVCAFQYENGTWEMVEWDLI